MNTFVAACMRADERGPEPPSRIVYCDKCLHPVYLSNSTPYLPRRQSSGCMQCIDWSGVDFDDITEPTPEQWEDIGKIIKGSSQ